MRFHICKPPATGTTPPDLTYSDRNCLVLRFLASEPHERIPTPATVSHTSNPINNKNVTNRSNMPIVLYDFRDTVSFYETLCSVVSSANPDDGQSPKPTNLSIVHHRQDSLGFTRTEILSCF
jgi:hypothetical protein